MAQGTVKKSAKSAGTGKSCPAPTTKKGARVAKPQKKSKVTKADKLVKKFTSGLVGQTERLLGERAGHLELIGKGRTKKDKTAATDGKKRGATAGVGGSRKFG